MAPGDIGEAFRERYGSDDGVRVFRAPGRVNLIGEHTDYNLGFVLPVALDLATSIAAAPGARRQAAHLFGDAGEMREFDADAGGPTRTRRGIGRIIPWAWRRSWRGPGSAIEPANLLIRSTVPEGSGLSSSAALEVASALALLRGRALEPLELARLCQRAEADFVGMPCGIMDQYISVFGREARGGGDRLPQPGAPLRAAARRVSRFLAVNTMVKHALGASAYRERVRECAAGGGGNQRRFPAVASLRDVTIGAVRIGRARRCPAVVARRARHVVDENDRVRRFVAASERGEPGPWEAAGGIAPQPAARLRSELRGAGFPGGYGARNRGRLRLAHDRRRIRRLHRHHADARGRGPLPGEDCERLRDAVPGDAAHLRVPASAGLGKWGQGPGSGAGAPDVAHQAKGHLSRTTSKARLPPAPSRYTHLRCRGG